MTLTDEKFDRINNRRIDLIHKQFTVGLTPAEEKIFDRIQNHTMAAIEENMPDMQWDFRTLIKIQCELKRAHRLLYPGGSKKP